MIDLPFNFGTALPEIPRKIRPLTPREHQVAKGLALGMPHKAIADDLCISIKTLQKHAQAVFKKLDVHDRVEVAHWALNCGLVPNLFSLLTPHSPLRT